MPESRDPLDTDAILLKWIPCSHTCLEAHISWRSAVDVHSDSSYYGFTNSLMEPIMPVFSYITLYSSVSDYVML